MTWSSLQGDTNSGILASAELYNPVSGSWTLTGSLNNGRSANTATLLPNGMVLVAGGDDITFPSPPIASAELYDPESGTWTFTGSLNTARDLHSATLLTNGMVLVAAGADISGNPTASAELTIRRLAVGVSPAVLTRHASCIAPRC